VFYDHKYFGVPQAAGPIDVDSDAISTVDGLIVDGSLGRLRSSIKEKTDGGI
jgi:hypothetical protein